MATHTAEMSIESLESRYRRDPASRIFPRLADAYREEGNIDKAIEICLNGLDLYPSNVTGRIVLGRCYFEQGRLNEAVVELKKVCSIDRRNQAAIKMLADIFIKQGMEHKAGDLYHLLSRSDPFNKLLVQFSSRYKSSGKTDLFDILGINQPGGYSAQVQSAPIPQEVFPEAQDFSDQEPGFQETPSQVESLEAMTSEDFERQFAMVEQSADDPSSGMEFPEQEPAFQEFTDQSGILQEVAEPEPELEQQFDVAGDEIEEENAAEISGDDISSRMSMMFEGNVSGESQTVEPEEVQNVFPQESEIAEELPDISSSEPESISGQDVSSRIEELFSGSAGKAKEQGEAVEKAVSTDEKSAEEKGPIDELRDIIQNELSPEFEETLQYDRSELNKELLNDNGSGDQSGPLTEDLIADDSRAEMDLLAEAESGDSGDFSGSELLDDSDRTESAVQEDDLQLISTGEESAGTDDSSFQDQFNAHAEDNNLIEDGPEKLDEIPELISTNATGDVNFQDPFISEAADTGEKADSGIVEVPDLQIPDGTDDLLEDLIVTDDENLELIELKDDASELTGDQLLDLSGESGQIPELKSTEADQESETPVPAEAFSGEARDEFCVSELSGGEGTEVSGGEIPELQELSNDSDLSTGTQEKDVDNVGDEFAIDGDKESDIEPVQIETLEESEPVSPQQLASDDEPVVPGENESAIDSKDISPDMESENVDHLSDSLSEMDVITDDMSVLSGDDVARKIDDIFASVNEEDISKKPESDLSTDDDITGVEPEIAEDLSSEKADEDDLSIVGFQEERNEPAKSDDIGSSGGDDAVLISWNDIKQQFEEVSLEDESPEEKTVALVPELDGSEEDTAGTGTLSDDNVENEVMTVLPESVSVEEDSKDTGEREEAPGFRYEMEKVFTGEEPLTDETPGGSVPEKESAAEIARDDREEVEAEPEPVESSYSIPDHVLTPTLADIYYQQGQYALAVQIYTRLLDRDPENGKLKRRLEEVKQAMLINGAAGPEAKPQKPSRTSVKGKSGSEKRMMHSSGRTSGKKKSSGDKRPLAGVRIKKNKKSSRGKKA